MWQKRGLIARLLWPARLLYTAARSLSAALYRLRLRLPERVGVPVIVVGNLYTGGTGKTPLVIELVTRLKQRGWHPGVITRGYGGTARRTRMVPATCDAAECGDEPVLIAAATAAP